METFTGHFDQLARVFELVEVRLQTNDDVVEDVREQSQAERRCCNCVLSTYNINTVESTSGSS